MSFIRNTVQQLSYPLSLLLLGCLLACTSCNQAVSTQNKTTDTLTLITLNKPETVSAADSISIYNACQLWYDTVLKPRGFSGGMIVAKKGNIIFEKYSGTCHITGTDTITKNTPMHIASISKTFTAMAVLKLWQDGKLNIDDEYSKYFTSFNYPGVTIRSLLSHRSGLPNYNYFTENLGWDKTKYMGNKDVLDFLISRKPELADVSPPNSHFSYCNTNFALLALLIEKVSGLDYATYLNHNFFMPLQMKNSYVFTLADTLKATPSYNWRGRLETFNFLDGVYGDKNIYTTPQDLLIWDRALNSNIIFTSETLQQAYSPYSNEKPGIRNYGLGWRMNIFPDGNKIIYHNGWWHGSNATFIRLIKEQATIIIIGNKFTRAVYDAKKLMSLFGDYYAPADDEVLETIQGPQLMSDSVIPIDTLQKLNKNRFKVKKPKSNITKEN